MNELLEKKEYNQIIEKLTKIDTSLKNLLEINDVLYQQIKYNLLIEKNPYKKEYFEKVSLNIEKNKKELYELIIDIRKKM